MTDIEDRITEIRERVIDKISELVPQDRVDVSWLLNEVDRLEVDNQLLEKNVSHREGTALNHAIWQQEWKKRAESAEVVVEAAHWIERDGSTWRLTRALNMYKINKRKEKKNESL